MEPTQQPQMEQAPQTPPQQTPVIPKVQMQSSQNKSSIGSIIGTIVIIAIIILGGLYFWGKRVEEAKLREQLVTDNTPQTNQTNEAAVIKSTTNSDDLDSLEADLKATNLNNLDSELDISAQ